MAANSTRERIETWLKNVPRYRGNSNSAKVYHEIYVWQELSRIADEACEAAWSVAQENKLIKSDDKMRDLGPGDHIVSEAENFSCTAKVAKPGLSLNKELLVETLAKKFKTNELKILAILTDCSEETKPRLTKRIMEAAS